MKSATVGEALDRAQKSADLLDRELQDVQRGLREIVREAERRETPRPRDSLAGTALSVGT